MNLQSNHNNSMIEPNIKMMKFFCTLSLLSWIFAVSAQASKAYEIHDTQPAPLTMKGWEQRSFPLGNGHFGVSFFGGIQRELWQVTEPTLFTYFYQKAPNPSHRRALTSAIEMYMETSHNPESATDYTRRLNVMDGIGITSYAVDGVTYRREQLTSFPDNCLAVHLTASESGKVSFTLKPVHSYADDEHRKSETTVENDVVVLSGSLFPYEVKYQSRIAVDAKGGTVKVSESDGTITVSNADAATVFMTIGSNYQLKPEVFLRAAVDTYNIRGRPQNMPEIITNMHEKLADFPLPVEAIKARLVKARKDGWDTLKDRHVRDVRDMMERCQIDLGGVLTDRPTQTLIPQGRRTGGTDKEERYYEELFFQFGRYLLVSSSRPGTLPANLQGVWNWRQHAPWTGGFWFNINFQMNYWPTFNTNLAELIGPYMDYLKAAFPRHQQIAYLVAERLGNPAIKDGWAVGTGNNPYDVDFPGGTFSGISSGAFVLYALWDAYLFTGDKQLLEDLWPFLIASSRFISSSLHENEEGLLLAFPSSSPEQKIKPGAHRGSAYDQQLAYEGHRMTLEAARILGKKDPMLATFEKQLPLLDPVIIGDRGHIKEFREEVTFGSIGDPTHRHISHLKGLMPGTIITENPAWLEAARISLQLRGGGNTGWSVAHRLNAVARMGDGAWSHQLLRRLHHSNQTLPNMWTSHPPSLFQIDANLGGTAGIAEMLLQSHLRDDRGFIIQVLPATPEVWKDGSFQGMRARGGYEVDAQWKDGKVTQVTIKSLLGKPATVEVNGQRLQIDIPAGTHWTLIEPLADDSSPAAQGETRSHDGKTTSLWKLSQAGLELTATIPANDQAIVSVPTLGTPAAALVIREGGAVIWENDRPATSLPKGITFAHRHGSDGRDGRIAWNVRPGKVQFTATLLATPNNFQAAGTPDNITLTWDPAHGAAKYTIQRATQAGGPYQTLAKDITDTTYTDTSVARNQEFFYVIAAQNATGNTGSPAPEVSGKSGLQQLNNASFEEPGIAHGSHLTAPQGADWTFTELPGQNTGGISANKSPFTSANPDAPDGSQVAILQGASSMSQELVGLTPQESYRITFSAALRKRKNEGGQTWDIQIDGETIASFDPPATATDYISYHAEFTATAISHTLSFVGTSKRGGGSTVFIDQVQIAPIAK